MHFQRVAVGGGAEAHRYILNGSRSAGTPTLLGRWLGETPAYHERGDADCDAQ